MLKGMSLFAEHLAFFVLNAEVIDNENSLIIASVKEIFAANDRFVIEFVKVTKAFCFPYLGGLADGANPIPGTVKESLHGTQHCRFAVPQ